jgi:hypothetical protein
VLLLVDGEVLFGGEKVRSLSQIGGNENKSQSRVRRQENRSVKILQEITEIKSENPESGTKSETCNPRETGNDRNTGYRTRCEESVGGDVRSKPRK